jgi:hypothetical protein
MTAFASDAFSLKGKGPASFPTRAPPSLLTHKSVHRAYKKITSAADENDRWNGPQQNYWHRLTPHLPI